MRAVHSAGAEHGDRLRPKRGTLTVTTGLVVLTIAALRGHLRRYAIAERSMEPALAPGDWTLARHTRGTLARGAIVVLPSPLESDRELIKRVVGLPGEHVTITKGQVHIDGRVLAEPWADGPTLPNGEWELGPEDIFVLGDARARSNADSRLFGPVLASGAEWRIAARYWPLKSMGRI